MKKTPKKYRKQVDILKSKYDLEFISQIIELEKQMNDAGGGDPVFFNALVYAAAELKN